MPHLTFYYSAMNAGKSASLIQASYNYIERGMKPLLLIPQLVSRGACVIRSRTGIEAPAREFGEDVNLFQLVLETNPKPSVVLVDEAQFMTVAHVNQLCDVVDRISIPVLAYGLRTDYTGALMRGAAALLAKADNLKEIKTICECGRKATMTSRIGASNTDRVLIGGNEKYASFCRKHHVPIIER